MPAGTSSSADLEFLATDGATWVPVMLLAAFDGNGEPLPKTLKGSLSASQADSPLAEWLEPVVQKSWIGGVGVDYNAGDAVYTRTDGYALPAGAVTTVTIPAGGTNTPIVAFAEYGGDLWAAEEGTAITGGRVLRLVSGTGAAWANSTLALGAGEILRDLCVADNGAGAQVLVASSTNTGGGNGRVHLWDGAVWTSSAVGAFGGNGRNKMTRVMWTTSDNVSAWRLVSISGPYTVAYTLPNASIILGASWVENAFEINNGANIDTLAAARRHVWVSSKVDIHDLTADGEAPGLLGYEDRTPVGLPYPVLYFNGYVYRGGAGTLTRIRVNDEGPTLQEIPGQCAPGWGTEMESEWRGHITALCVDQGYLVCAVWNPITTHTGVFWGMDRAHFPPGTIAEGRNPLIWYGPELYSDGYRRITAMTASMLAGAGDRRLWVGSLTGTNAPETIWQSLPLAGAPISDLISGGYHRFTPGDGTGNWNTRASLRSMPFDWNDPTAAKFLNDVTVKTRGLDAASGTKLTQWVRADPPLGSLAFSDPQDITVDYATTYTPAATTAGHLIDYRVYFTSPNGTAALAANVKVGVLDAVRMTAWRIAPTFQVLDLVVEYGDGVPNRENTTPATWDPALTTTSLIALCNSGRTTMRDPYDNRWTVKLRQVYDVTEEVTDGPYGKRVTAHIQLALLATL